MGAESNTPMQQLSLAMATPNIIEITIPSTNICVENVSKCNPNTEYLYSCSLLCKFDMPAFTVKCTGLSFQVMIFLEQRMCLFL